MKKIIPALAMLLISAIVMSTASFAWFSMSTSASATGMQINAIAGGALLIDDTNVGFEGGTTHNFNDTTTKNLDACTWTDATKGYECVAAKDKADVDANTGAFDGTLTAVPAATAEKENGYYIDYIVYLASDKAYTAADLTATVTFTGVGEDNDTLKATTIDFYYQLLAVDTNADGSNHDTPIASIIPSGWSNRVTVNASKNGTDADTDYKTEAVSLSNNQPVEIPAKKGVAVETGKSNGAIAVLMRVYFDGDLSYPTAGADGQSGTADDGAEYYVRSNAINTNNVGISVTFGAAQQAGTTPDAP